jgi:site-specific DNA-methyltransferase (adenine-specific)
MPHSPYYEDKDMGVVIYNGDCREILRGLGATFDLLLTDPPYGVGYQSNRRTEKLAKIAGDDGSLDVPAALALACKKLRRFSHAYVFGRFDFADTPLTAQCELIWDKEILGSGDLSSPWGPSHEPITFAVFEPSKANREKGAGRLSARIRQGSVLRCPRLHSGAVKRHPNEKPVPILRQMIESSSILGDTVLDPFMGSGSTLEAAVLEGRAAIGIELDEAHCRQAVERLGGTVPVQAELEVGVSHAA